MQLHSLPNSPATSSPMRPTYSNDASSRDSAMPTRQIPVQMSSTTQAYAAAGGQTRVRSTRNVFRSRQAFRETVRHGPAGLATNRQIPLLRRATTQAQAVSDARVDALSTRSALPSEGSFDAVAYEAEDDSETLGQIPQRPTSTTPAQSRPLSHGEEWARRSISNDANARSILPPVDAAGQDIDPMHLLRDMVNKLHDMEERFRRFMNSVTGPEDFCRRGGHSIVANLNSFRANVMQYQDNCNYVRDLAAERERPVLDGRAMETIVEEDEGGE